MSTRPAVVRFHDEPLRFLLDYAEAEGALCERGGDTSYLLLPREVGKELEVDEELTVTADPEVAREDGAVLIVHGHPILDRTATAVLDRGDVGWSRLAWPASAPPPPGDLIERARATIQVDHGRIDPTGAPAIPAYLPVLRVGALVIYAASLDDRFQEREEVWIDARTCRPLDASLRAWLLGRMQEPGRDPSRRQLTADIRGAVAAADALIEARAITRQAELAIQTRGTREAELARAAAYYGAALESIAARAGGAPADRRSILAAQAEVTIAERDRRLAEINERNEARHEIRPFRLHLIGVPALTLAAQVRRGARAYPLELTWMLGGAGFAPLPCPHCGGDAELVAGRERLGCRACLPPRALDPAPALAVRAAIREQTVPDAGLPETPSTGHAAVGRGTGQSRPSPRPVRVKSSASSRPKGTASTPRPDRERRAAETERLQRMGHKLASMFWDSAVMGDRWPSKATVAYSPLSALARLYGAHGPLWAIGVPPEAHPVELSIDPTRARDGVQETSGRLLTTLGPFRYSLRWQLDRGDVVAGEILPYPSPAGALRPLESIPESVARRLCDPPQPLVLPDGMAARIWDATASIHGLSVALRCLSLWSQVRGGGDPDLVDNDSMAEAVVVLVRSRAGLASGAGQACLWESGDSPAERAANHLLGLVGDPRERPW